MILIKAQGYIVTIDPKSIIYNENAREQIRIYDGLREYIIELDFKLEKDTDDMISIIQDCMDKNQLVNLLDRLQINWFDMHFGIMVDRKYMKILHRTFSKE